jgi:hypothetical protein
LTVHRTKVEVATVVLGVGLVFALFAFGAIRAPLSSHSRGEWLATVGLGRREVLLAVAGTTEFSLDYVRARYANHVDPVAAQALNVAANAGRRARSRRRQDRTYFRTALPLGRRHGNLRGPPKPRHGGS